jgi:hypothetical protein
LFSCVCVASPGNFKITVLLLQSHVAKGNGFAENVTRLVASDSISQSDIRFHSHNLHYLGKQTLTPFAFHWSESVFAFVTALGIVIFEVITAVIMKNTVFSDVAPCSVVEVNTYLMMRCHTPGDNTLETEQAGQEGTHTKFW